MTGLPPEQSRTLHSHHLSEARVGHLATADESGVPHVIPVCFAVDGDHIYSVLDQKPKRTGLTRLRRVRNILSNPQATLVADHYEEDWSRLWYVMISGRAELLLEGEERSAAILVLRAKYPQYRDMDIDENPVIKITVERVIAWGGSESSQPQR